jgi:hypothetical protein
MMKYRTGNGTPRRFRLVTRSKVSGKKRLPEFQAAKLMRHGVAGALVDAVILQPKLGGVGFDLKKFFSGRKR